MEISLLFFLEVFTSNMTIAVIMVHPECPEVLNSRRNRVRSHLSRDLDLYYKILVKFSQSEHCKR